MRITRRAGKARHNDAAPIHRLPTELLSEIFVIEHTSTLLARLPHFNTLPCLAFLSAATSTCSRWRNVAVGTPQLWSWITYSTELRHKKAAVCRVETFLKRSSTLRSVSRYRLKTGTQALGVQCGCS